MMKHGVEAKNYEELAKAEKLKPLEVVFQFLKFIFTMNKTRGMF